jgi:hypothetical protein
MRGALSTLPTGVSVRVCSLNWVQILNPKPQVGPQR